MSVICEDAMSVFMMNISRLVSCFRTSFVFNEARHHEKAYLQHDVEGQQSEHNEFVSVKQAAPCVIEHHVCAGVKQGLQTDLHGRHQSASQQQNMCSCVCLLLLSDNTAIVYSVCN